MNLTFIQPILTKYREPFFSALGRQHDINVKVLAEAAPQSFGDVEPNGFAFTVVHWRRALGLHWISPARLMKELKDQHKIVHFVDFKYLSLWFCLFLNPFWNKQVFLHGHGGYKRQGMLASFVHFVYLLFASGYICYCDYSARNLRSITPKFLHKKISVVPNSLYLKPAEKSVKVDTADRIFYVGRVRERCGLELLLKAAEELGLFVDVVGAGNTEYEQKLKFVYKSACFHGPIFDEDVQRKIAKNCFCGVYAGDAGLSVVHYMAFGLPAVAHGDMRKHMGPEPSYIADGKNGLLFERGNVNSLSGCLRELACNSEYRERLATEALKTFIELGVPPMHERFVRILCIEGRG